MIFQVFYCTATTCNDVIVETSGSVPVPNAHAQVLTVGPVQVIQVVPESTDTLTSVGAGAELVGATSIDTLDTLDGSDVNNV